MLFIPSVYHGMARSGAESVYPSLWNELRGLWIPAATPFMPSILPNLAGRGGDFHTFDAARAIAQGSAFGPVIEFDGSNSYAETDSDHKATEIGLEFTFAAFVYLDVAGSFPAILTRTSQFNETNTKWSFYLTSTSRRVQLSMGGTVPATTDHNLTVTTGQWDFVAAVNDVNDLTYYVNEGSFSPASGSITTLPTYGGKPVRMGAWTRTAGEWDGKIAFAAIWNRRLKVPELALLRSDPYGIIRQRPRVFKAGAAPVGGLSIPVAMHHYTKNVGAI